ncbi:hypothetical protein J437_LFUL011680 [Ladona fulva]|uniref:Reverse transcriptase n=1 Tax=Ladona fulva TaxID=123851 RepID=A0A8K0KG02_LADFU|nr:hypothetical protein J437_LFUL011680 [Ladona fulva]
MVFKLTSTNSNGAKLFRFLQHANLQVFSPNQPTYQTRSCTSLLDFIIVKDVDNITSPMVFRELNSDHYPILFSISGNISSIPHSPGNIRELFTTRNRIKRLYQTYHAPEDFELLKQLNYNIKQKIAAFKNKSWNNYLSTLSFEDHTLWQCCKRLTRPSSTSHPLNQGGALLFDPEVKAEYMASYLSSIMTDDAHEFSRNPAVEITNDLLGIIPTNDPVLTTEAQVANIIKTLVSNKAPGPDQFSNRILKTAAKIPLFLFLITNLFNACHSCIYFPDAWKIGHMILLPNPAKTQPQPPTIDSSLSFLLYQRTSSWLRLLDPDSFLAAFHKLLSSKERELVKEVQFWSVRRRISDVIIAKRLFGCLIFPVNKKSSQMVAVGH